MRRPRNARKILAVIALAFIFSFDHPHQAYSLENNKIKIIATLFPQYDMAKEIGKEGVKVSLLLPPGVEAHSFEPKPRDIAQLNSSDIFIYTGRAMEPWVEGLLKGLSNKSLIIVDASKGVKMVNGDPHIWLDMDNAAVMADNIREALSKADPGHSGYYSNNAEAYRSKLKEMDNRFRAAFAKCRHRSFIFAGHPAFGYFDRRYNITTLSPYKGYSPDSEPSPKAVMELVDKLKETGIKYVFYEELLPPKLARTIAAEAGALILPLNAAHNVSREDLDKGITFISILEEDLENLKKGMECQDR